MYGHLYSEFGNAAGLRERMTCSCIVRRSRRLHQPSQILKFIHSLCLKLGKVRYTKADLMVFWSLAIFRMTQSHYPFSWALWIASIPTKRPHISTGSIEICSVRSTISGPANIFYALTLSFLKSDQVKRIHGVSKGGPLAATTWTMRHIRQIMAPPHWQDVRFACKHGH